MWVDTNTRALYPGSLSLSFFFLLTFLSPSLTLVSFHRSFPCFLLSSVSRAETGEHGEEKKRSPWEKKGKREDLNSERLESGSCSSIVLEKEQKKERTNEQMASDDHGTLLQLLQIPSPHFTFTTCFFFSPFPFKPTLLPLFSVSCPCFLWSEKER